MILDSGNREHFPSGAVRDIQEDKGRCDLMPLGVVGYFINEDAMCHGEDKVLNCLSKHQKSKTVLPLYSALNNFCHDNYHNDRTEMMLDVSIHYRDGAEKYGENNWQKGLPTWSYFSSAVRHYLKHKRGDTDERHDRAFVWNVMCLIWTIENIKEEKK